MSSRQFVSPQVFARLAGISESTLWRRIRDGSIPSWQPGGRGTRVLVPLSALDSVRIPDTRGAPITDVAAVCQPVQKPIPGPRPQWLARTQNIEET